MASSRILFTFGTLFEPQVISALLGYLPQSFLATLKNYAVFQGTKDNLPEEIVEDIKQKRDIETFTFLFAKQVPVTLSSQIDGKAYHITEKDELIIDRWERFPIWYQKENVEIQDESGKLFRAYVFVTDEDGLLVKEFNRVPYELNTLIDNARKLRAKILNESGSR